MTFKKLLLIPLLLLTICSFSTLYAQSEQEFETNPVILNRIDRTLNCICRIVGAGIVCTIVQNIGCHSLHGSRKRLFSLPVTCIRKILNIL